MVCRNCNTEYNGRFCPNCGAPSSDASFPNPPVITPDKTSHPKKPVTKRWWFWVLVVIFAILLIGSLGEQKNKQQDYYVSAAVNTDDDTATADTKEASVVVKTTAVPTTEQTPIPTATPEPTIDLTAISTEYTLTAGNYVAGIDIPAGKCSVVAVSGQGNLSSSNMYDGGINEMFGINDGTDFYTSEFSGLKLPDETILTVGGTVKIKITYTSIEAGFRGRTYDESGAIELGTGNYEAGIDFEAGVYKIVAISGTGNLSSDNMFFGGLNEMFGIDDGYGFYTGEFNNADLPAGTELSVSGGVKVKLIPAKEN